MKFRSLQQMLCVTLSVLMFAGSPALADSPVEIRSADVALAGGVLNGMVVNEEARPVAGLPVTLRHGDRIIATATSDERGQFAVQGLRTGGHVLQVGSTQRPVRFWTAQSAPPAATSKMAIVVNEEVVRGQSCGDDGCGEAGCLTSIASNPFALLLLGGAAAGTAIAINANSDNAAQPASP